MRVYLDLVVALNFAVDFLLLLGTNRLSGFPAEGKRAALGAALGSVYAGACLMPGFSFLGGGLWRLVSLALMGAAAFGWNVSALRRTGIFILLSMAMGGIALGFGGGSFGLLLLCALGVWGLCRVGLGGRIGGREYVNVSIQEGERAVRVTALRDSGNTLRDPLTGEQVTVIGPEDAQRLTGLTRQQLNRPMETMLARPIPGLRLIPYRTVGSPGGMLLGKRFARVKIGTWQGSALVAFAPEQIGTGEIYQALTGGAI